MMPMDSNSKEGLLRLWGKIKGSFSRSAQAFLSALPLFALWLMIPFALLILNSLYQSGRLLSERNDRSRTEKVMHFIGKDSTTLTLHISYPKRLRVEPDKPYDDSIAVWLTGPVVDISQGQKPPTYTFSLSCEDGLADFMDDKGNPISGIVALSPVFGNSAAEILYLKSNPSSLEKNDDIVIIVDQAAFFKTPRRIPIPVELLFQSRLRHFWDSVLSLPTLIGGLLTAIAGFALQQVKVLDEEEQRSKTELEESTFSRLEEARKQMDYQRAFGIYQDYIGKVVEEPSSRIKGLFDDHLLPQKVKREIKDELDKFNFQEAIDVYSKYSSLSVNGLENIWNDLIFQKFNELLPVNNSRAVQELYQLLDGHSLLTSRLRKLWSVRENYYYYEDKITVVSRLRQLLRRWPEIIVYEGLSRKQERADIKAGMDFLGVGGNPFGAEKAEEDFLFASRVDFFNKNVNSIFPISSEMPFDQSQIIIGRQGSGKTALALFLAGQSFSLVEKTFPLFCKVSSKDNVEILLSQITEVLLNYYTKNPGEFLEHDIARQSAMAVLLSNYVGDGAELSFRLKLAGISAEESSVDFHDQIVKLTRSAGVMKLTQNDNIRLLIQTLPLAYERALFLFDFQDVPVKLPEGNKNIVNLINELHQGRSVTVKVFSAPSKLITTMAVQLQLPSLEINWSYEKLKDVLRSRMDDSRVSGLGFWFDVSTRSISQDLLLKASGGTPGGLIHKGNQVLKFIGENKRILNLKDVESIFGTALVKKVLKESQEA